MANKLMQLVVFHLTKDNNQSWSNKIKELLISQDMWEIVGKSFEIIKDWRRLTSTKRDQCDDLKTRDKFALFLIFCGVNGDTFGIIRGATTKYAWDVMQKTYEERKTETTHEVMEFEEGMKGIQEIYKFEKETEEVQEIEEFKKDQLIKSMQIHENTILERERRGGEEKEGTKEERGEEEYARDEEKEREEETKKEREETKEAKREEKKGKKRNKKEKKEKR